MNRFIGAIRGYWVVLLLLLGISFGVLLISGNIAATLWVNSHHRPVIDEFFAQATLLGDWVMYLLAVAVGWRISHRHALAAVLALALCGICVSLLKHHVFPERSRPAAVLQEGSIRQVPTQPLHRHHSFPSGHTATAFAGFCCMAFFTRSFGLQALFALSAGLVGYSRMYLGQHFLADVLAGAAIGTASALFSEWLFTKWQPAWLHQNRSLISEPSKSKQDDATN
jgi:membrane-associated phospholipid phosphatase